MSLEQRQPCGLEYLELVTALLQRARRASTTGGLWEAADLQWWWRRDQHPELAAQTFWLDEAGPIAAAILTNWGPRWGADAITADVEVVDLAEVVWPAALEQIAALGIEFVETTTREEDVALVRAIISAHFEPIEVVTVATWMSAAERPGIAPLAEGFRLVARSEAPEDPHPMIRLGGNHIAERLAECSLYRPELDLAVFTPDGDVAAYGLFWADTVTAVGLVEPMRTQDRYQGLGLGRHLLTTGLDLLAAQGCSSLKVSYVSGNTAAQRLYLGAGFRPAGTSRAYRRCRRY